LFQISTINALLEGVYDGEVSCKALKEHGDVGIGTFSGLDGEMIELDGDIYQIKADGQAYLVDDSTTTPFAVVTFFEPDKSLSLDEDMDYKSLESHLDGLLPTKSLFYAIKIEGDFKYIKTRSVPKQSKPYPKLVEVTKNQPTFEFHNVEGTMVGFRCPLYVEGINVPGYHIHFLTKNKQGGGHLLECIVKEAEVQIDYTPKFYMVLPEQDEFYKADLAGNKQAELEKVEK
jgi:acetolactate decarboxylase